MNATPSALRVSVICPVFNTQPAMLCAAARSVLDDPSGQLVELILCDDASTDLETIKALDKLAAADSRVVILRTARNGGPSSARNAGLARANGDWVGFIDSDDLWTADHLSIVEQVLVLAPEAAWISARHEILDHSDALTPYPSLSASHEGTQIVTGIFLYAGIEKKRGLVGNYWLHLGGCIVKTELARKLGFDVRAVYSEDWLFFLRLSLLTDLYYIDRPTYMLRRTHESFTRSPRRLTALGASGRQTAYASPELAVFRRELRWALVSTYKGIAANNLIAGYRIRAAWFALQTLRLDPRDLIQFFFFIRLIFRSDRSALLSSLKSYSTAELISASS